MSENEQWLNLTIPKIAKNLDSCAKDTHYVLDKTIDRFISQIYFARMFYTNKKNQHETQFLVIKKSKDCNIVSTTYQFHNEMVFYQMFYQLGENFPKCFYSHVTSLNSPNTAGDYSTNVLEDVSKKGFQNCPVSFDPPYSYILAVVRELGRFHAKGYVLKEKNQAKFYDIVNNIQESRYSERNKNKFGVVVNTTPIRAVEYLYKHGYNVDLCKKMKALFSNAFEKVMQRIIARTELSSKPLSTICHGDPVLSNTLFQPKTNGDLNAMLIDFGLLIYGTPAIDLSIFFCLSCTTNMIRDKLYDILKVYHLALTNYMSLEGVADTQKYSFDAILNDYKEGCLFGYVIASFYLAKILDDDIDCTTLDVELTVEEQGKLYTEFGGDEVSAKLAEMLLQMIDLGCLEYFL